ELYREQSVRAHAVGPFELPSREVPRHGGGRSVAHKVCPANKGPRGVKVPFGWPSPDVSGPRQDLYGAAPLAPRPFPSLLSAQVAVSPGSAEQQARPLPPGGGKSGPPPPPSLAARCLRARCHLRARRDWQTKLTKHTERKYQSVTKQRSRVREIHTSLDGLGSKPRPAIPVSQQIVYQAVESRLRKMRGVSGRWSSTSRRRS